MKQERLALSERILNAASQQLVHSVVMRMAIVAAISEGGLPVQPILARMDRMLAEYEAALGSPQIELRKHLAEVKSMIADPCGNG